MAPISSANGTLGVSGSAVIETRPASAPFRTIVTSTFLYSSWVRIITVTTPAHAAMLVLTKIFDTSLTSLTVPIASCDAPLKPNQPSHRMNVPKVASGMFEPGKTLILPST